jgi:hypothetical protein
MAFGFMHDNALRDQARHRLDAFYGFASGLIALHI